MAGTALGLQQGAFCVAGAVLSAEKVLTLAAEVPCPRRFRAEVLARHTGIELVTGKATIFTFWCRGKALTGIASECT